MADLNKLMEMYTNSTDPQEQAILLQQIGDAAKTQPAEEAMTMIKAIDERVAEIEEIIDLGEVADMASMSYIAKKYFNRSRSWLSQRLNGHIIHGKPARLTAEERETLAKALDDMSRKLKEKSLSIMNG